MGRYLSIVTDKLGGPMGNALRWISPSPDIGAKTIRGDCDSCAILIAKIIFT